MAITLCSGLLAVVTLRTTTARASSTTRKIVDDLAAVQAVRVGAEQLVSAARGYLLTGDRMFHDKLEQRERDLETSLAALRSQSTLPSLTAHLSLVEQRLLEYSRATIRATTRRSAPGDRETLELSFERELQPRRQALDEAVGVLVHVERASLEEAAIRDGSTLRNFGIALLAVWGLAIAISIGLALIVMRTLNAQYRRVEEAKLAATDAAESRKQILEIVAHDLLNPLHAIILGLDVLSSKRADVPQAATITRAAERMQRLVNDLLDVSRAQQLGFKLERRVQRVGPHVETAAEQFRVRAQRAGVRLRVDATPDLEAFVDGDRIVQILSNLVGNALRVVRRDDEIVLSATQRDGCVRFGVSDTGPGISRADIEHLFEAYRQGPDRRSQGSLGLGLFICKTLVEAQDGHMGADSVLGHGSTFWFEVPAAPKTMESLPDV